MKVIGLTGSIGMGKTTVSGQFAALGAKVLSSDNIVHHLLGEEGFAAEAVRAAFPKTYKDGIIDRAVLGRIVFDAPEKLAQLEDILHPLVVEEQQKFIQRMQSLHGEIVVLDIPLLFETWAEERCDKTVVVTAPAFLQKQRVMRRAGMNETRFERIMARQMPDAQKRDLADYVVHTGLGRAYSFQQVARIMKELQ